MAICHSFGGTSYRGTPSAAPRVLPHPRARIGSWRSTPDLGVWRRDPTELAPWRSPPPRHRSATSPRLAPQIGDLAAPTAAPTRRARAPGRLSGLDDRRLP